MKKNNKGFTLVEIIAVVTILGILLIVSIPKILSLVTDSRNEMYVQDAKKLIAQAQYVLSSNSDEVEKPVVGDYIVLSLNYLGTDGFSSPPNGGEYLTEASFVVVKNIQTDEEAEFENYKYSVVLVEAAADGYYRGIKFRTEEELSGEGAKTLVDYFESDELVYVDEDAATRAGCEDMEKCLVNNVYVDTYSNDSEMKPANVGEDNFVGRYNVLITQVDNEDKVYAVAPEFSAKVLSTNASMQMLTGSVDINASFQEDQEYLKVCINISKKSSNDFPSIDDSSSCIPYFKGSPFVYEFNLLDYGFTYEDRDTAYFYIVVADEDRNYSRKRIPYEIHKNTAPEISEFIVTRHSDNNGINFNMNFASLSAEVKDDMDDFDKLSVCISDKSTTDGATCSNYVPFYSIFGNNNYKYYFKDNKGNQLNDLDGSSHYLTLFVRDSSGLVSKMAAKYKVDGVAEKGPYVVYENKAPVLKVDLKAPKISPNGYESGNSLKDVEVIIDVSDDMTKTENIKIKIGDYKEASMAEFNAKSSPLQKYSFSGDYDGEPRSLVVTATDEFGKSTTVTAVLNNVYKNAAPKVNFKVTSSNTYITMKKVHIDSDKCKNDFSDQCYELKNYACTDKSRCIGSLDGNNVVNGSYTAHVETTITDDLSTINDMLACLTENKNGCTKNEEFVPASTFTSYSYPFKLDDKDVNAPYISNPDTRTLYLVVKDPYGAMVKSSVNYSFYENRAPKFISVGSDNITSTRSINISSVKIKNNFLVDDDFYDYDVDFCYVVKDKDYSGGNPNVDDFKKCTRVTQNTSMDYVFNDDDGKPLVYNGQKVYTLYKATDGYGAIDTIYGGVYTLSSNVAPKILDFSVESLADKDEKTNLPKYNSVRFNVKFKVSDPEDTYRVCITTLSDYSKGYCDASTYEGQSHFMIEEYSGDDESEHVIKDFNSTKFSWNRTSKEFEQWKYSFDVESSFTFEYEINGKKETKVLPTIIFVVKDSSGDTDSVEYNYIPRYSCGIYYEEMEKIKKKAEQEKSGVAEGEEIIEDKDIYMEIESGNDYEALTIDEAKSENQNTSVIGLENNISPESCNGICYENVYTEDIDYVSSSIPKSNSVNAYFKRQISYIDKLVQKEIEEFGFAKSDSCNNTVYDRLGCTFASCFDTKSVNNNVISLHLYDADITWTSKVKSITSNRNKYNSYCKFPEKQNDLLFWKNDYRKDMDINVLCNSNHFNTECVEKYESERDFIDPFEVVYENCDAIQKPPAVDPECYGIDDPDYCNGEAAYIRYAEQGYEEFLIKYNEFILVYDAFLEEYNPFLEEYIDFMEKYDKLSDSEQESLQDIYDEYERKNSVYENKNKEYTIEMSNYESKMSDYKTKAISLCTKSLSALVDKCEQQQEKVEKYNEQFESCNNRNSEKKTEFDENAKKKETYEKKVETCTIDKKTSCDSELLSYINGDYTSGKIEVSCSNKNNDSSVHKAFCRSYTLDGKCLESNCSDGDDNCKAFCYKDLNCNEKANVELEVVCHGYFKLYRSTVVGRMVKLEDTGMRLCPELLSSKMYSNKFNFNSSITNPYIKFFPRDYGGNINGES